MLNRAGNKSKIANSIIGLFPKHDLYVEPFFGAGGVFFRKPLAKYNIMNDLDNEIYNFWQVLQSQKNELLELISLTPIHESIFFRFKKETPSDPLQRALRTIYLANYSYLSRGETMSFGFSNSKSIIIKNLNFFQKKIENVMFMNCDFREVIDKIAFGNEKNKTRTLIYADPPYINTCHKSYKCPSFTQEDTSSLFDMLVKSRCMFAISELDNAFITELALKYKLNITHIINRRNLFNRADEVLISNFAFNKLF